MPTGLDRALDCREIAPRDGAEQTVEWAGRFAGVSDHRVCTLVDYLVYLGVLIKWTGRSGDDV
jgi:hypothetical protein